MELDDACCWSKCTHEKCDCQCCLIEFHEGEHHVCAKHAQELYDKFDKWNEFTNSVGGS